MKQSIKTSNNAEECIVPEMFTFILENHYYEMVAGDLSKVFKASTVIGVMRLSEIKVASLSVGREIVEIVVALLRAKMVEQTTS